MILGMVIGDVQDVSENDNLYYAGVADGVNEILVVHAAETLNMMIKL